jgi:hypothetical protein
MLTCKELARSASSGELEETGWIGRLMARLHLLACRHCRQYLAQLAAIRVATRRTGGEPGDQTNLDDPADNDRLRRLEEKLLADLSAGAPKPPNDRSS